jgi:dephospho-CoA kinase
MAAEASHIIGLTGLPSVGKGEVACALAGLAAERGWRLAAISFSDQIKDEAQSRGIPEKSLTREALSRIGTDLRAREGPGVLAARIAGKIQAWPGKKRPEIFVCDGVRHPGEAEALRAAFGKRFILVAVEAEPREIVRRLIARRRPDESPDALRSDEGAIRLLERELNGAPGENAPNVGDCIRLADRRIPNHGTLEDLRRAVAKFFRALVETKAEETASAEC